MLQQLIEQVRRIWARLTEMEQERWHEVAGVVETVHGGVRPTVDVRTPAGIIPELCYQAGAAPTGGEQCWVHMKGSNAMWVNVLA